MNGMVHALALACGWARSGASKAKRSSTSRGGARCGTGPVLEPSP